uniref:Histone H3.2 n=1 Tax=Haemonchus contortus TaxID=6289 RepID=A0A7I4XVG9_HAECO
VTRSAMARYFSFPLLLMALLLISTVIPSASSKKTSLDKKKSSVKKVKGASAKAGIPRVKRFSMPVPGRG